MKIPFLFNLLLFLLPLTFLPLTSELFEFNKIILVYIFTTIICAVWAQESFSKKKFVFRKTALDLPIIIFLGSQILSTFFSIDTRTSVLGYYGRFHGGLVSYVCYSLLYWAFVSNVKKTQAINLLKTLTISSAIVSIYAALEHFGFSPSCLIINGETGVGCFLQDVQNRVFGTFGQPNWLAAYLVAVIPISWFNYISHPGRSETTDRIFPDKILSAFSLQNDTVYITISTLLFTTFLFTKSRSGLAGLIAAFAIFWALTLIKNGKKALGSFIIISSVFLIFLIAISTPWRDSLINRSEGGPARIASESVSGGTESGEIRRIVWRGALNLWLHYPILGTGVETFAYSYYETRPIEHNITSEWNYLYNKAHNEYLNFAATTGTLGIASYMTLILASIILLFRNRKSIFGVAIFSGYVSILVTNFFGFSTVTIAVLFFLFPAITVAMSDSAQNKILKLNFGNKLWQLATSIITIILLILTTRYWYADYLYAKGDTESIKEAIALINEPVYHDRLGNLYSETSVGAYETHEKSLAIYYASLADYELNLAILNASRNVKVVKSAASAYGDLGAIDPKYLDKSQEIYKNLTKLAPTDAAVWYQLAYTSAKQGNSEEAKKILSNAIDMKPDYKLARQLSAYLAIQDKDYDTARKQYEYILKHIAPEDERIREELDLIKNR
jgi:O-antigen ligase